MKKFKTIGILGGLGPVATAYFFERLLEYAQIRHQAVEPREYPHVIINSVPFLEISEIGVEGDEKRLLEKMKKEAKRLKHAGAELIAIPCNSVNAFVSELTEDTKVEIVDIIDEVIKKVKNDGAQYVAVLNSRYTYRSRLYYQALERCNIEYFHPDEKMIDSTAAMIRDVMGGRSRSKSRAKLLSKIDGLKKSNIDSVILGCTELPVALKQEDVEMRLYDSVKILAEATLDAAYIEEK